LFTEAFVNATGVPVELYNSDGSVGAAIGAGIGAGIYTSAKDAFREMKLLGLVEPTRQADYDELYHEWKALLKKQLDQQ
jgi:xylulokinase